MRRATASRALFLKHGENRGVLGSLRSPGFASQQGIWFALSRWNFAELAFQTNRSLHSCGEARNAGGGVGGEGIVGVKFWCRFPICGKVFCVITFLWDPNLRSTQGSWRSSGPAVTPPAPQLGSLTPRLGAGALGPPGTPQVPGRKPRPSPRALLEGHCVLGLQSRPLSEVEPLTGRNLPSRSSEEPEGPDRTSLGADVQPQLRALPGRPVLARVPVARARGGRVGERERPIGKLPLLVGGRRQQVRPASLPLVEPNPKP